MRLKTWSQPSSKWIICSLFIGIGGCWGLNLQLHSLVLYHHQIWHNLWNIIICHLQNVSNVQLDFVSFSDTCESNNRLIKKWYWLCRGCCGALFYFSPNYQWLCQTTISNIDGFAQDCSNSIANALELLQSCAKPLIYCSWVVRQTRDEEIILWMD